MAETLDTYPRLATCRAMAGRLLSGGLWPGVTGDGEEDGDCKKGQLKLYFFDNPHKKDDGTWEVFERNDLQTLAEMFAQWNCNERRADHCWAVLGIVKYVRDTGAVLSAPDQSALDAWVPLAQSTLGVTERNKPFKIGVPIVCVGVVLLQKGVELEITGQIDAPVEYNGAQIKLMLALSNGPVCVDLLLKQLRMSEGQLEALAKGTDGVSSMRYGSSKKNGTKKKQKVKSLKLYYELMGNPLKLATSVKEGRTWVANENAHPFFELGSPGKMDVSPDWLDSLVPQPLWPRCYPRGLDVYGVTVKSRSLLSTLVQQTNQALTTAQQSQYTTGADVEDALVKLGCGLEGAAPLSVVCRGTMQQCAHTIVYAQGTIRHTHFCPML